MSMSSDREVKYPINHQVTGEDLALFKSIVESNLAWEGSVLEINNVFVTQPHKGGPVRVEVGIDTTHWRGAAFYEDDSTYKNLADNLKRLPFDIQVVSEWYAYRGSVYKNNGWRFVNESCIIGIDIQLDASYQCKDPTAPATEFFEGLKILDQACNDGRKKEDNEIEAFRILTGCNDLTMDNVNYDIPNQITIESKEGTLNKELISKCLGNRYDFAMGQSDDKHIVIGPKPNSMPVAGHNRRGLIKDLVRFAAQTKKEKASLPPFAMPVGVDLDASIEKLRGEVDRYFSADRYRKTQKLEALTYLCQRIVNRPPSQQAMDEILKMTILWWRHKNNGRDIILEGDWKGRKSWWRFWSDDFEASSRTKNIFIQLAGGKEAFETLMQSLDKKAPSVRLEAKH